MANRRKKNLKEGVSPILATSLLAIIAVAAVIATYAWIETYMNNTNQQTGAILRKEHVIFDSTSREIIIEIQNIGLSDTKIRAIYISTEASQEIQQMPTQPLPLSLLAGTTETLTINNYNWESGEVYNFRVLPSEGEVLNFSAQAPL